MTDIAASAVDSAVRRRPHHAGGDPASARVRRRYRADARFNTYGILALVVTTVFLVVLLIDIVR
jgi:hypothetical protein